MSDRIPVKGYEGFYEIDRKGQVFGLKSGKMVKTRPNNRNYLIITLSANQKRKTFLHHRLVAECFLPNPKGLEQINHINGDKHDNRADNLEWCSREQNWNHAKLNGMTARKLSPRQVDLARELVSVGMSQSLASKLFSVSQTQISRIVNERQRVHG